MNIPVDVPAEKCKLLENLTVRLSRVPGIQAIVLGGSYANGTHHQGSDLDIGLYYYETQPFSLDKIRKIAKTISRPGLSPTVTGFYEWGHWVNGGAWIETDAGKVDFLYRNLDQIQLTILNASKGIIEHDYDQQPTHGFYSIGYLAETFICVPLYDPQLRIAELKKQVKSYPARLKQKIIVDSLWSAEFTLKFAIGFADGADIYNTVGCLTRTAAQLTQALFALNERYFLSDKKVMETIASFEIQPVDYTRNIAGILACPGQTRMELVETVARLNETWQSVKELAGIKYQSKY